ncbi:MAG TPA: acyl-CoA dehydrogenase [Solirubrobacterales bacterium]|nr:acyl-CoA dehydrogenase [Solirubrobacterales bacterium]
MFAETSTALDATSLQRLLDGEHAEIRDRVREGLRRPELERGPEPPPAEEYRERVLEWAKAIAAEGDTGLGFPSEFGGMDNVPGSIAAFETLALGDLSLLVKCGVQFGLFGGAVLHLGTRKHHERYLRDLISLELPGCFAMTETGHGSNVQRVGTTATYDAAAEEFVVHTPDPSARKDYIGNAALHGRMAAVFAQLVVGGESRGVHCLLVPIRDERGNPCEGVELSDCGHKVGLNGVDNGRISFDHVRVPRDALLDRYAEVTEEGTYRSPIENPNRRFFTMLGTLIQGRVSVCGGAISAAKLAQTIAVRHANRRRQFGPPESDEEVLLLDYRAHQRRLLPALAKTYALHFAQQELIAELGVAFGGGDHEYPEEKQRALEAKAAGVKALATWHASKTIQECREACGGAGYLSENRFGELRSDIDVFTTFEGDNTILLQLVAKGLLTNYRDEFGELNPIETAGFVASQVYETVVERSALRELAQRLTDDLIPGREEEHDLLDREYQANLLRWREEHMLSGVARRLRRGIDAGENAFDVFNECQDHVVGLAHAHVEREVLEAFIRAIEEVEDAALRELLSRVCDLHALATIEADRAWFQEHGRISSTRAKALTRAVNALCAELRPAAGLLVDGFGIPDEIVRAPIGVRDYG